MTKHEKVLAAIWAASVVLLAYLLISGFTMRGVL